MNDHIEAFINAFVVPPKRPRLVSSRARFLAVLSHDLPKLLMPNRVIEVGDDANAVAAVRSVTECASGVVISAYSKHGGERELGDALEFADQWDSNIVSIEKGELAFYKSEDRERFLLASDPERRKTIRGMLGTGG